MHTCKQPSLEMIAPTVRVETIISFRPLVGCLFHTKPRHPSLPSVTDPPFEGAWLKRIRLGLHCLLTQLQEGVYGVVRRQAESWSHR